MAGCEARLTPLAHSTPAVEPPSRVWKNIEARIRPARRAPGFWNALGFWRALATAGITAALVIAVFVGAPRGSDAPVDMVAVMQDRDAVPAMVVLWPRRKTKEYPYLQVKAVYQPETLPGTSLELWMLPGGSAASVSLGVIDVSMGKPQLIKIKEAHMRAVGEAWAVALSMEPQGGSPTGRPTTGYLYHGLCVKVM